MSCESGPARFDTMKTSKLPNRGRAIFLTHKNVSQSPRVLNQISWLIELGWTVDTVGLDPRNAEIDGVVKHFTIQGPSAIRRYWTYISKSFSGRYEELFGKPITEAFKNQLRSYDLLIIHDLTPIPFVSRWLGISGLKPKIILDFHENHLSNLGRNFLEQIVFDGFRDWLVAQSKDLVRERRQDLILFSPSVQTATAYAKEFDVPTEVLFNVGSFMELSDFPTNDARIKLVHHGMAASYRGQESLIVALKRLPPRFVLTFILVGSNWRLIWLRALARLLGVSKKVIFESPVPAGDLPKVLNHHDIAVMLLPPVTENQLDALPGKFFDAIQARLAVVTGPNPSMKEIVLEHHSGIVLKSWSAYDLASSLAHLTHIDIQKMKNNQNGVAKLYNAESNRSRFIQTMRAKGWLE